MKTNGSAVWQGGLKDGKGAISTQSGALAAYPYGFASRFEGKPGTNPEELIGAAHAGCFTMALAFKLQGAGHTPESLETEARLSMEQEAGGWTIAAIALILRAKVPGIAAEEFQRLAADAKATCPVSRVLKAEITLDAALA